MRTKNSAKVRTGNGEKVPPKIQLNLYLPADCVLKIRRLARADGRSTSNYLHRNVLLPWLAQAQGESPPIETQQPLSGTGVPGVKTPSTLV